LTGKNDDKKNFINGLEKWLDKIIAANNKHGIYEKKSLHIILASRWYYACYANYPLGAWVLKKFFFSKLGCLHIKKRGLMPLLKIIYKILA
jgi:hypothetical protein